MRKLLIVVAASAVLLAVGAAIVAGYALYNLNSLIAGNQARILSVLRDALKRPISFQTVTARAGWGIWIEITGLTIAEDPAFSETPFVVAPTATIEIDLIPILHGRVRAHAMTLVNPNIRLLENTAGTLNIDSIGGPPSPGPSKVPSALASLFVGSLKIEDGLLYYNHAGQPGDPLEIKHIEGEITGFNFKRRFQADLKFAFLNDQQNFTLAGSIGPLAHRGEINTPDIPMDLGFKADSVPIDGIKKLVDLGDTIPAELAIPEPAAFSGTLKGRVDALSFSFKSDLSAEHVSYSTFFAKPAKLAMNLDATGELGLVSSTFTPKNVNLQVGGLDLKVTKFSLPAKGPSQVQLGTNAFSLASVGPAVPLLATYRMTGTAEVHGTLVFADFPFSSDGTISLTQVSMVTHQARIPGVSDLTATVTFKNRSIVLAPSTFALGSAHATVQGSADSIRPLRATYQFDADAFPPAVLLSGHSDAEVLNHLHVAGTGKGSPDAPQLDVRVTSSDGLFDGISYSNLDLTGTYAAGRFVANPLKAQVFSGSIVVNGSSTIESRPQFSTTTRINGVDIHAALLAIDPKTEHRLHGTLNGNVKMAGAGGDWKAIQPMLRGSGNLDLRNGKVVGLNIVADAINKIAAAPGVSQIMNATFMSDHRGVLADPDTELEHASMTFVLADERITTHDLSIKSKDYGITGDGWVDLDNNISMSMDITMTFGLSVTLPVYVKGHTPVILVVPNIPQLAERIALGAISVPGKIIEGGVSGLKGLVGDKPNSGGSSIGNPLDKLKGWLP